MARPGGNPDLKPGPGRPKGSLGRDVVKKILKEEKFDPVREIIKVYKSRESSQGVKLACAETLLDRIIPRLKAVDLSNTDGTLQNPVLAILMQMKESEGSNGNGHRIEGNSGEAQGPLLASE